MIMLDADVSYANFYVEVTFLFRITNLKYWSQSERLVDDTLTLLSDLSIGYTSVRKLVRLPEVQFLMNNHTVSQPGNLARPLNKICC